MATGIPLNNNVNPNIAKRVAEIKAANIAKQQQQAMLANKAQNTTNVNSSNPAGINGAGHLVTDNGAPYVQGQGQAPVLDFSNYLFGKSAEGEQSLDPNYLRMRNLNIANQLVGSGVNDAVGASEALKSLPGRQEAPENDRATTMKNILSIINSGQASDPVLQKFSNKYMQNWTTNPGLANRFMPYANDYGQISDTQNNILNMFKTYESALNPYLNNYADANFAIDKDITNQLNGLKTQFESQYGPNGEQRVRLQDYYSRLADEIGNDQVKNMNEIDAQARVSGASQGAARNARQKATVDNMKLAVQYKKQEVADYDNIYKTLNDYLTNYIKMYGDSKDTRVKDTYAKLLDWKNQLGASLINSMGQLEQFKVQDALSQAAKTGISIRNS